MTIIETRDLNKVYRGEVEFQALKDVNIKVQEGEFIAITGPSGSGKSTLLYVLSTLDSDFTGEVIIHGNSIRTMNAKAISKLRNESIGFVFQFHYLLPEFSVLQNVTLPALKLGKYSSDQIEHLGLEKLEWLGLSDQANKKATQLSGGQQQRVAIARALMNEPGILFCDEPTGNLDSANSRLVFDIFTRLKNERKQTIVMVTHDKDLSGRTDRSIQIRDGEIVN